MSNPVEDQLERLEVAHRQLRSNREECRLALEQARERCEGLERALRNLIVATEHLEPCPGALAEARAELEACAPRGRT